MLKYSEKPDIPPPEDGLEVAMMEGSEGIRSGVIATEVSESVAGEFVAARDFLGYPLAGKAGQGPADAATTTRSHENLCGIFCFGFAIMDEIIFLSSSLTERRGS